MKKLLLGSALAITVLAVAACQPAKSEERHEHRGPGIGMHVGPGGAGVHVGPLHGGVGFEHRDRGFHRGFRVFSRPSGYVIGDPCWVVDVGIDGRRYWEYVCD